MNGLALAQSEEKNWSGMVGATALYKPQYIGDDEQMTTSLDDEIEDSPVGQDDMYTVVSFGGAYSF
jgi:outer membrane scaffolding protein for murein synthesis (MipA/OmpV family)